MSKRAPTKKPVTKPVHLASLSDDESEVSSICSVSDYSEESESRETSEESVKKPNPVIKKPSVEPKGKGKTVIAEPPVQKKVATKIIQTSPAKVPVPDPLAHVNVGTTSSGLVIHHSPLGYYCEYVHEMNESFNRRFGPGQLLINGMVFNNPNGKCCVLLDVIPLIFEPNSIFMTKYYLSIIEFINAKNLIKNELPGIMIYSRPVNTSSKFHEFKKHIFEDVHHPYVSVVGLFYDPEHDTIVATSGSVAQLNESSKQWLTYTFLRDDETYGHAAIEAIDTFMSKKFNDDRITKYVYVPNNVWLDEYDDMCRMMTILVLTTMVMNMAPVLEARLIESVRRKDEILAKQAEAAKVDEELPKDLPSKASESSEGITDSASSNTDDDSQKIKSKNRPASDTLDADKTDKPHRHRNKRK
jgi:hypothetical protein